VVGDGSRRGDRGCGRGALEIVLVSRIYRRRIVDTLLITFGVSLVMFQLAVDIFGTTPPGIETPLGAITIGAYSVPTYTLVLVAAAIGISVGLYLLLHGQSMD
jgi:urea transport system permease protein